VRKKRKRAFLLYAAGAVIAAAILYFAWRFNVIPHRKYSGEELGIERFQSSQDRDGDGIDDQTDILEGARAYVETNPKYKSKYYADTGYPDDEYGVCTDVVAFALRDAGYDLMELVDGDIGLCPEAYDIEEADKNIDFRRVKNLRVWLERNAVSLTTDLSDTEAWQGGDIVVWSRHIGIVSDMRNREEIPFVLHNANPFQFGYEEDILETWGEIVGHYRMSR